MQSRLVPMFFSMLKEGYKAEYLAKDIIAGLIVGIVALPLAIAFAIASGVAPQQGLYTAVTAGFIISAFGGSRFQIGGPTGAFVVIVYGIVAQYGYDGLAAATFIAGVLLIIMGLARLGSFIKFIPYPLTIGFTSGIALIIFSTQIRDFLGLTMQEVPVEFVPKLIAYYHNISSINPYALLVGAAALLIINMWPRITHRIPGSFVAIIFCTLIVKFLHLPVETIGSRFGSVPASFPVPHIPHLDLDIIRKMFPSAVTIALLAAIESLLSAVVADGMSGTRHRSNMEVFAQGAANIGSVLFGGIPATGAIARTATNIRNGACSPVSGMIHSVTLLLIMLFFGKYAVMIPMAVLAAILIVVAINMSEAHLFLKIFRSSPNADVAVMLVSFALTVLVDLTAAIQVGVVLAAFLFMHRMSELTQSKYITGSLQEEDDLSDPNSIYKRSVPAGVEVFEIYGPFFFGAADKFKTAIHAVETEPKVLILRMRHVITMDATAVRALEDVYEKTQKQGSVLVLSGVHSQPLVVLERSGLYDRIGRDNITGHIDDALNRACDILNLPHLPYTKPFVPDVVRDKHRKV